MFCFFRCPADFVGPQCQFPNPCSPSPCRNGGVCRARTQGNDVELTCDCVLGYSGPLCLTPVNHACMGSPCRNGGTCSLLTLETFTCRCSPGWSGTPANISPKLDALPLGLMIMILTFVFPQVKHASRPTRVHRTPVPTADSVQRSSHTTSAPALLTSTDRRVGRT